MTEITPILGSRLARIALGHVRREFPHSENIRLNSAADLAMPRENHPIFYGSYDWHSCVHSYWLLARLLRAHPALPERQAIIELFDVQLTAAKVAGELAYFLLPGRQGFERPYGWAWLLKLSHELAEVQQSLERDWSVALAPLAEEIAGRFVGYLPKLHYPIRSGNHANTAFALTLALDYAQQADDQVLRDMIVERAQHYFLADSAYPAWEPGGEDFLSPGWQEALLMQRVLPTQAFATWFSAFLPTLALGQPLHLLQPAGVSDRSDGRLAHLDGLNLSRAWCLRSLGRSLPDTDPRRVILNQAAQVHQRAGMAHLQDDYMGEHWLATFALLAQVA